MSHPWPVRVPRPVARRLPTKEPLVTGQRVIDALFPVALGGKAAIPGGFGTGKTVLLEALAKGCAADVVVYLGCGERGNEMAERPRGASPQLVDPAHQPPLMERTVIVANTSNMPVAAREASIYYGHHRGGVLPRPGLHVALHGRLRRRWAEALREVSGRFGEMPGEERLSRVPRLAAGGVLRARGAGRDARRHPRVGHRDGALSARHPGALLGAGHQPRQRYVRAFWALTCSARRPASTRPCAPAPGLLGGCGRVRALWNENGYHGVAGAAPARSSALLRAASRAWRGWPRSSARTRCRRASSSRSPAPTS